VSGDPLANAARTERARSNAGSGQADSHDDDLFDFLDDRGSTGFGLASHAAGLARSGGAVGSGGGGAADQHANYLDREDNVPPEAAVSAFVCVAKLKLCALAAARHAADARADTVAGEVFAALDPTNTQFVSLHDVQRWLQQHAGCAALTAQDLFLIFGASSSSNGNDIKIREELSSLPPAHTEARDPVFGGEPSGGQDVRPSSGADEPEVAHLMDRASFRAALGLPPHRAVAALLHRLVRVVHVRAANRAVRLAQARRLGSGTGHSSCRDLSRGGLTVAEAALLKRRFRAACVAGGVAALDRPAFKQLVADLEADQDGSSPGLDPCSSAQAFDAAFTLANESRSGTVDEA